MKNFNLLLKWVVAIPTFLFFASLIIFIMIHSRLCNSSICLSIAHKFIYFLSICMLFIFGIKVKINGAFPKNKRNYIIMSNHVSWLDMFVLGYLFAGKPVTAVSKKENFYIPVFGQAIWLLHVIGVSRNRRDPKGDRSRILSIANKCERLKLNLLYFPEGTRTSDGKIGNLKIGGFEMAKESGLEIIPVVMNGLHRVNNKKSFFNVNPGLVQVSVGRLKLQHESFRDHSPDVLRQLTLNAMISLS
jgi:1-acyl-sn-glycerol-3-phosphate acyltransferase